MNVEDYEQAMASQWRNADILARTDLYDSAQDVRSDARYEDDPQAEPARAYGVSYER